MDELTVMQTRLVTVVKRLIEAKGQAIEGLAADTVEAKHRQLWLVLYALGANREQVLKDMAAIGVIERPTKPPAPRTVDRG